MRQHGLISPYEGTGIQFRSYWVIPFDAFQQRGQLVSAECSSGAAGEQNVEKSCVEIVVSVGNMRLTKTEARYRILSLDTIFVWVSIT